MMHSEKMRRLEGKKKKSLAFKNPHHQEEKVNVMVRGMSYESQGTTLTEKVEKLRKLPVFPLA